MRLPVPDLPPKVTKVLRLLGYPVFYLVCLVLFARLTFPYDRVKDRIVAEFDARQKAAVPNRLEIEEVSGHWLFGVEAEGVRLISPPGDTKAAAAGDGEEKQQKPSVLQIDALYGSVSPLRLLFGTLAVDFGLELGEGEVEGRFVNSSEESELEMDISGVSVAGMAPLEEVIELPLGGVLNGRVQFVMPEGKLQAANGSLELSIESLEVGDGKAKIRNTIALPKLRAGTLNLTAEAVEGKLDLKEFSANGPDFQLSSNGSVRLRDPFASSISDVRVTFKFKDAYKNKNDITRGLFGAPDSNVPGLFDLDPKIKQAKGADGFYSWRASGQVARMNFTPGADTSARRPSTSARSRRPKPTKKTKAK